MFEIVLGELRATLLGNYSLGPGVAGQRVRAIGGPPEPGAGYALGRARRVSQVVAAVAPPTARAAGTKMVGP